MSQFQIMRFMFANAGALIGPSCLLRLLRHPLTDLALFGRTHFEWIFCFWETLHEKEGIPFMRY